MLHFKYKYRKEYHGVYNQLISQETIWIHLTTTLMVKQNYIQMIVNLDVLKQLCIWLSTNSIKHEPGKRFALGVVVTN